MVALVDTQTLARLVRTLGFERFLRELAAEIANDMKRWQVFEKSARLASHSRDGVIELMPTTDGNLYSFKFVNGHPGNTAVGLLTVTAFGALADVKTGYPVLISEMTLLTALRTAATSALAARHLARSDSLCMAIIGTGAQAEFQALAFKACLGITKVRYFDLDLNAMSKFAHNLSGSGLDLIGCDAIETCVRGADIITTATALKGRQELLHTAMVSPGVHINAIGGDCPGKTEVGAELLAKARVFVEYEPQTRIEGDIQNAPGIPVTELWRVIAGVEQGRRSPADITVFDSVGFALEDFSALRFIHQQITRHPIASDVSIIPNLDDPKDLFGYVLRAERPQCANTGGPGAP